MPSTRVVQICIYKRILQVAGTETYKSWFKNPDNWNWKITKSRQSAGTAQPVTQIAVDQVLNDPFVKVGGSNVNL